MKAVKSFFAALGFLTFVPVPAQWKGGLAELGSSVFYFPIIGLLIGVFVSLFDYSLSLAVDAPDLVSALTVLAMIAVSRGLHLDGLADTADGFLSGRPRTRMLEIMRDSRLGTFGALAIVGLVLLKWTTLDALQSNIRWSVIAIAPLAGRASLVFQLALLNYAREDGGLADAFVKNSGAVQFTWSLTLLAGLSWCALGWLGLALAGSALLFSLIFAFYCYRKIRGLSGDTLGASAELVELVVFVSAVALRGIL